jgi:ornithine cyclodeaminase/alanine dehydrogenase-like protein (mu-crystallin family)
VAPPASALHVPDGSFHAKGAALLGADAKVAIKINGNFPGNPAANGLPTVQGVIYLADGANGTGGDGFDRGHHQSHRCGHHARRPPSRAAELPRRDGLRC